MIFGIWIGLAFMMKTFLVAVPLLAILPYLFFKKAILLNKFFWFGLFIGFIPFLLWMFTIDSYLEKNIIFYLFEKFNTLSDENNFTNPFYYYFWNIPLTFLPWSLFAIIGIIYNASKNKHRRFILTLYPSIVIFR